jgi:hypothetical protein
MAYRSTKLPADLPIYARYGCRRRVGGEPTARPAAGQGVTRQATQGVTAMSEICLPSPFNGYSLGDNTQQRSRLTDG